MWSDVGDIELFQCAGISIAVETSVKNPNKPYSFGADLLYVRGPGHVGGDKDTKVFKLRDSVEWKSIQDDWWRQYA